MSEKKSRNQKSKREKIDAHVELDSDENFAFIVGYTSGGAPYGLTHEEMAELEKKKKTKQKAIQNKIEKCRLDNTYNMVPRTKASFTRQLEY